MLEPLPIPVRRVAYRWAHRLLRVYWFVRRPPLGGVKCVLTDRGKVLLVRHTYGRPEWDLPGGGPHRDESPLCAARREMEEELGLRPDWRSLGEVPARMYGRKGKLYCFQAEVHDPTFVLDRGEIARVEWFAPDELPDNLSRWVRPILARLRLEEGRLG